MNIITAEDLHKKLMPLVQSGASYLDALTEYSKTNNIEMETLGEIIRKSQVLKEKIRQESAKLNLLRKEEKTEDEWFS